MKLAYQLVVANNSHNRERLDAVRLGVEGGVASSATLVAKDDIRVNIGIEILLAGAVAADGAGERGLALGVGGLAAAAIVGSTALDAVAVNVHVCELAILALEVDDLVVGRVVTTVREGCAETRVVSKFIE